MTRITGTWHCIFMIIPRRILLRMRNSSGKNCTKIKTHILCSITFLTKIMPLWDNVKKCGRARQVTDDNIIRRMRFACWITKVTDTHSEYEILIAFSWKQWLRERASILLLHVHCLCCSFSVQYFIANICWKFSFTDFRDLLLIFKVVCVLNTAENCKLRLLQTDIDLVRK